MIYTGTKKAALTGSFLYAYFSCLAFQTLVFLEPNGEQALLIQESLYHRNQTTYLR